MMKKLLGTLFLAALYLGAADLTGQWTGSFDVTNYEGNTKSTTAYMDLKEADGRVTGTAGPSADQQFEIREGKLDSGKLTFEVTVAQGVIRFSLVFDGKSIKGDAKGDGANGEQMRAKLDLQRAV